MFVIGLSGAIGGASFFGLEGSECDAQPDPM